MNSQWSWSDKDVTSIKTPFNIEKILKADSALLGMWVKHPFYLDIEDDKVIIKYIEEK